MRAAAARCPAAARASTFLLEAEGRAGCHVEVKNCHMRRSGRLAEFPDAVTRRGARHMDVLAAVAASGRRAVVVYCVQRADCAAFAPAADIDPGYAAALRRALESGVEALAYACRVSTREVAIERRLPIVPARPTRR